MNHDRLFKELLSTFFLEFIALFLPKLRELIDSDTALIPINKELFSDDADGQSGEVDLVMRAKIRGEDAFFLVHVEHQASSQSDFPRRMYRYFSRLMDTYNLPVYPVVIYSHSNPLKTEPTSFRVELAGKRILLFEYDVVQLNRIPWRSFLRKDNAVACALMAKLKMRPTERAKVKAQCMRMLVTLKLDPMRTKLLARFIDSYLKLNDDEMKSYSRAIARFAPEEREVAMELMTSWEEKGYYRGLNEGTNKGLSEGLNRGLSQGLVQGKEQVIFRLIRRRFGEISSDFEERIDQLKPEQLDDLTDNLLDFESLLDVIEWLDRQRA